MIAILETHGGAPAMKTTIKAAGAKHVHAVRLHPTRPLVVSAHSDGTARASSTETGDAVLTIAAHGGSANGKHAAKRTLHQGLLADMSLLPCVGITLHPTGEFAVSASSDRTWTLLDLNRGIVVVRSTMDASHSGYACASFHPDGLILATATESIVRVWEVSSWLATSPPPHFEPHHIAHHDLLG